MARGDKAGTTGQFFHKLALKRVAGVPVSPGKTVGVSIAGSDGVPGWVGEESGRLVGVGGIVRRLPAGSSVLVKISNVSVGETKPLLSRVDNGIGDLCGTPVQPERNTRISRNVKDCEILPIRSICR